MGLTTLTVEIGNPATPEVTEKVELLVDSGAVYSVVPQGVLERLGIKPVATEEFRLADGSKISRKKGIALFRFEQRTGGVDVILRKPGDSNLLGTLPLRSLVHGRRSPAPGTQAVTDGAGVVGPDRESLVLPRPTEMVGLFRNGFRRRRKGFHGARGFPISFPAR